MMSRFGRAHDRGLRVEQRVDALGGAGIGAELRRHLAAVHRAGTAAELLPGHAEQRVVDTGRDVDRARLAGAALHAATDAAEVDLPRLPGPQAFAQLLREAPRVGRRPEGVGRQSARGLVVLAAAVSGERQRQHHVGTEGPHDAHDVAERVVVAPLREGLLDAEREAELVRAAEVLLDRVVAVQRHQLGRAQDAERVEQLRADRVLPALAARDREERRAHAEPAREAHEDAVVLVVGMRGHVEHAAGRAERRSARPRPLAPRSRSSGTSGCWAGEAAPAGRSAAQATRTPRARRSCGVMPTIVGCGIIAG